TLFTAHFREAGRAGNPHEVTVDVVRPGMERTGEAARAFATRPVDDLDAAVLADVQQRAHLAVVAARQQDRRTGRVVGLPRTRFGEVTREADEDRIAVEEDALLLLEELGVRVDRARVLEDVICHLGRLVVEERQRLAGDVAFELQHVHADLSIVSGERRAGSAWMLRVSASTAVPAKNDDPPPA